MSVAFFDTNAPFGPLFSPFFSPSFLAHNSLDSSGWCLFLCTHIMVFKKPLKKEKLLFQQEISDSFSIWDHPFKTSTCLGGEGCPHVPMVKWSQYIRIKNPLHKHFAGMPMVGG